MCVAASGARCCRMRVSRWRLSEPGASAFWAVAVAGCLPRSIARRVVRAGASARASGATPSALRLAMIEASVAGLPSRADVGGSRWDCGPPGAGLISVPVAILLPRAREWAEAGAWCRRVRQRVG